MSKIEIDANLCSGHGRCYTLAPEVYQADEEGFNAARGQAIEVDPSMKEAAQFGIDSCPEGAIRWISD